MALELGAIAATALAGSLLARGPNQPLNLETPVENELVYLERGQPVQNAYQPGGPFNPPNPQRVGPLRENFHGNQNLPNTHIPQPYSVNMPLGLDTTPFHAEAYDVKQFQGLPSTNERLPDSQANNPLLDLNQRNYQDFTHNNMVPFFGSHVRQDMRGTGLEYNNINTGADGVTPHQQTLENFTGCGTFSYRHKREAERRFEPEAGRTYEPAGMNVYRPDVNRYKESIVFKNDMRPVEPEIVGRGLALDPAVPAAGGLHEYTRVLPNNVSNYKANQLPGRVAGTKWQLSNKGTATPGIPVKNRPETYWTLEDRPIGPAKSYIQGQAARENFENLYPTNRYLIFEDYEGNPALVNSVSAPTLYTEGFRNIDNNIRSRSDCNYNDYYHNVQQSSVGGYNKQGWYAVETDRGQITPHEGINLQGNATWKPTYINVNPTLRESINYGVQNNEGLLGPVGGAPTWNPTYINANPTQRQSVNFWSRARPVKIR